MNVVLVERGDIGCGTSADSTKLIHGGLRYLEHGELPLVYESLHERERLLDLAPHLVRPMRFMIPIYKDRPYSRPVIGTGLLMYDILTGLGTKMGRHSHVSRKRFTEEMPLISDDGFKGGFAYYDAQVPYPERLCLENAIDAAANSAKILTRHEVTGFIMHDRKILGARIVDRDKGEGKEIRARLTINAAGAWVDVVLNRLDGRIANRMGGTRGMHLLMPQRENGPKSALYTPAKTDGRPFFIVPWREYYWVGTTDLEHKEDPDTAVPTESEREYLLNELNYLLPGAEYTEDDIIYAQTGVRPLPAHNYEKPGAITRKHIILDHRKEDGVEGLISIIGGKLTTYRSLSEQTVDAAYRYWHEKPKPCTTRNLPLPGAGTLASSSDIDPDLMKHLYSLYGMRGGLVAALAREDESFAERLDPELPDIAAQVVWAVREEMALHVDDVLLRRTGIGTGHTEGLTTVEKVADIMADELDWSPETRQKEIENYKTLIDRIHRFHPG